MALFLLVGQVLAGSGGSSIPKSVGPDYKLSGSVLSDSPDPFSPNADGRSDTSIIILRSEVTPTDGLRSQGTGFDKTFHLRATITVRHPLTDLALRRVEADVEIPTPPAEWGIEKLRVEAQAVFDGRDDAGNLLPDGIYPYDAEVSFLRTDPVKNGPPHVKIIDSDFVEGNTIKIDTTPPRFDSLSPGNGFVSAVPFTQLSGTLSEPATLTINGDPVAVSSNRSFTFDTPLDPGENLFTLLAEDAAGNQTTQSLLIIFDNVPPVVSIVDPESGSYLSNRQPTIRVSYFDPEPGSGIDLATLSIMLDGADVTPPLLQRETLETVFVPPLSLTEGPHTISAVILDRARNVGEADPVTFTVDVTPPVLTVNRPKDDLLTNQSLTPVSGTVNEEGTVTVNGVPTPLVFTEVSPFTGAPNAVFPPVLTFRQEGLFVDGFDGNTLNDPWTDVIHLIPEFGGIPVSFANGEIILDTGFQPAGSPSVVVGAITKPDQGFTPQSFHVQVDMTIEELIGSFQFGLRVGAADVTAQPPQGGDPLELIEIAFGKAFEPGVPSQTGVVLRWRKDQTDEQAGTDLSFAPGETWRFSLAYDHVGKTVQASLTPDGGIPAFEHTVQNFSIDEPFGVAVFSSAGEPDGPTVVFDSRVVVRADHFVSDLVLPQASQISFSPLSLSGVDYDQAATPQGVVTGIALFLPVDFDPSANGPPPLILTNPSPVPLDGTPPINLALVTFSPSLGSARTTIYTPLSETQLAALLALADPGGSSIDAFIAPLFEPLVPGPGYGPAQLPTGGAGIFAFDTTTPLSEGENVVEIIATDRAGNFAIKERHPTLDTIPPVVTVEYPPDGLLTNQNPITVRGTVNEPAIVYVNGIPIDLTGAPQDVSVAPGFGQSVTLVPGASETLSEDFSQGIPPGWATASKVFQPTSQTPQPIVEPVGGQVVLDTLLQAQGTSGASASLALSDSFNVSQGFNLSADFQVQILDGGGGFGITLREPDVPMGQQGGEIGESVLRASFNLDPNNRGNIATFSVRLPDGTNSPLAFQELGPILDGTVLTFSLSYDPTLSHTISARIFDNQRQELIFNRSVSNFTIDFPVTLAFQVLAAEFGNFPPGSQPLLSNSRVRIGIDNLTSDFTKPGGYRMSLSPMQTAGQVYGQIVGPQGVVPGLTGAFFFGQGDPVIVSSPGTLLPGVDGTQNINVALLNLGSFPARITAYTTVSCGQLLAMIRQFDLMTSLDACVEPILRNQGAGNPYLFTPPTGGLPSGPLEVTIPERFTSPGSLSFLPSGPFEDNFDSGLPFTFWRLSGSGLWEGNTGDVRVDSLGRLRMEVNSEDQGNRNFVMTSVPKFARQSFSSSIEVMIDPTSTGSYDLFFNFGLLPVNGSAGRLICGRLPIPSGPFQPGALVSTCDAFTSDSFPSEGFFPNLAENVSEADLIGHTLTLTIEFDAVTSAFIGRVEDRTVSPTSVLFESGPIPTPAIDEFRLAFGASAGRYGSQTDPGASGRIVTYWDNFTSSLTREGSYFISHTAFALGGVEYADFVEFLPGTSGPIFVEGLGIGPDVPAAQVIHDSTGVEGVDGVTDYNVALISVAGFIRMTLIAAQGRDAIEQALLELEQREGISANIDAFFPSVFKAPLNCSVTPAEAGVQSCSYTFELPPPVEGPPPVFNFQIALPMAEGQNTITVSAVDLALNASLPVVRTVTVDSLPPSIAFEFPTPNARTNDRNIFVRVVYSDSGSGVDLSTLQITLDGVDITPPFPNPSVTELLLTVPDGSHGLTASVQDLLSNHAETQPVPFSVDASPPALVLSNPYEGQGFPSGMVHIEGSVTDISSIFVTAHLDGEPLLSESPFASGPFSTDLSLNPGAHTLTVSARDDLGNSAQPISVNFVVLVEDDIPPTIDIVSPVSGSRVEGPNVSVNVIYSDNIGVNTQSFFALVDGTVVNSYFTIGPDGASGSVPLTEGSHTLAVAILDLVGNPAVATSSIEVFVDTDPPSITIVSPRPGEKFPTTTTELEIEIQYGDTESGIDLTSLRVLLDGEVITNQLAVREDEAVRQWPRYMAVGPHTLEATVADNAGLQTSVVTHFSVELSPPQEKPLSAHIVGRVFHGQTRAPLSAVETWIRGLEGTVLTDSDGQFTYPTPGPGNYDLTFSKQGFIYGQRSFQVNARETYAVEDVFMWPLDPQVTHISKESGGVAYDSRGIAELTIPPGALEYDIDVSITIIPKDEMGDINWPAGGLLPPDWLGMIEFYFTPPEVFFKKAATIRIQNVSPVQLFPRAQVGMGFYDEKMGQWLPVQVGEVEDDGTTINLALGRLTCCTIYTEMEPDAPLPKGPGPCLNPKHCNPPPPSPKECGGNGSSLITYADGALLEDHIVSLGKTFSVPGSLTLTYSSRAADPRAILQTNNIQLEALPKLRGTGVRFSVAGSASGAVTLPATEENIVRWMWDGRGWGFDEKVPTGIYPYSLNFTNVYPPNTVGTRCVSRTAFGGGTLSVREFPMLATRDLMQHINRMLFYGCNAQGVLYLQDSQGNFVQEVLMPLYPAEAKVTKTVHKGEIAILNRRESSIGSGWWFKELDRIVPGRDGKLLLVEGNGALQVFSAGAYSEGAAIDVVASTAVSTGSFLMSGATAAKGISDDADPAFYLVERSPARVVKVWASGRIEPVAGGGWRHPLQGGPLDNIPALDAVIIPTDVASDRKGNVYITDLLGFVYRVDSGGILHHVAGTLSWPLNQPPGEGGFTPSTFCASPGDLGSAKEACFAIPIAIDVDDNGIIYVADWLHERIRAIHPSGFITTVAGTGAPHPILGPGFGDYNGDNIPATEAHLNWPVEVKVHPDGRLFVADSFNHRIRYVDANGIIHTFVGGPRPQDGTFPFTAPSAMDFDPFGRLYFKAGAGILVALAEGTQSTVLSKIVSPTGETVTAHPLGIVTSGEDLYWLDGGLDAFVKLREADAGQPFEPPTGERFPINRKDDGWYYRTLGDGPTSMFDPQGRLRKVRDRNGRTTEYRYDSMEHLTQIIDPAGRITELLYDGNGKLWKIIDPIGRTTVLQHDGMGNLTRIVAPDGATRGFTYDAEHRMVAQTNPRGFSTVYVYDELGMVRSTQASDGAVRYFTPTNSVALINNLPAGEGTTANPVTPTFSSDIYATITDARGNETAIHTNEWGQATRVVDPLGRVTQSTYNEHGEMIRLVRPNSAATAFTYDDRGNVLTTTRESDGAVTTFTYDPGLDLVTSTQDALNRLTRLQYDLVGNLLSTTTPDGAASQFTYDPTGLLTSSSNPLGNTTAFSYDTLGNLSSITDPLNNATSFQNDLAGNVIATTDALGRTTRYTYDLMNRLAQVTDPLGGVTRYTYDASGNLTSVHDPHDHMTTFSYDSMNRLISSTDPLGRTESYLYDLNGNLVRKVKRDGTAIDYLYDPANQLLEKRDSLNVTRYSYDLDGNLTSVTDSDSDVSFVYDPLDRVLRTFTTQPVNSVIEYSYDAVGNRLTMKDPQGGVTSYQYDTVNRLLSLSNPSSQIWNFSYDPAGRRTRLNHPNGITTTYNYDPASRMTAVHHDLPTAPVAHSDYAYDPIGNVSTLSRLDGADSYQYDVLNRLTGRVNLGTMAQEEFYSYDAVGNRIASHLSAFHVHNAANERLEDEEFFYSYDLNGNQTGKMAKDGSEQWVYTYDAENQLVAVRRFAPATATTPSMTATYAYDGLGGRIRKVVDDVSVEHVYDNQNIVLLNGVDITHGPSLDEPLQIGTDYLLQDRNGNVIGQVQAGGAQFVKYDSFGNLIQGVAPTLYGFTGREHDTESDIYYYRARYFDPHSGRFLSRDPLIFYAGDPNLYAYVGNNPINFVDPLGLIRWPGDVKDDAKEQAENSGLPDSHNGAQDAYRHCLASCMMAMENGQWAAEMTGWANEKWGDWRDHQEEGEREADEYNNMCGRRHAKKAKKNEDCAKSCRDSLAKGHLREYEEGTTPKYKRPYERYRF